MEPAVRTYLDEAPPAQRPVLETVRALILEHLPGVEETCERFPVYTRDGAWAAGFATRAKGPMFYLMDEATLDAHADRLGRLRSGKGCVELRATRDRSQDELLALVVELLQASAARHA